MGAREPHELEAALRYRDDVPLISRRGLLLSGASGLAVLRATSPSRAQTTPVSPSALILKWYRLVLELVRHTPTYSPPVASRAFAYLGTAVFEAVAGGSAGLRSLAGQINGLEAPPPRETGATYDEGVMLNAVLVRTIADFFGNTGPTGQRVMSRFGKHMTGMVQTNVAADIIRRSEALGFAIASHISAWSKHDGGAVIENMGFPLVYDLKAGPAHWVPTSLIQQQQKPLLPGWGQNRSFALPHGAACPLPAPPEYSEGKSSEFYRQALEVYQVSKSLTPDQRQIARFWSDDPMLSPTPPGHWMSIAADLLEASNADLARTAETLTLLGLAMADAFIACWHSKYEFDLLRPITYIQRVIDPAWQPMLITPPFPEYPSGHSTQSGAAAEVLTRVFGATFAFGDSTHEREGLASRQFSSFWEAAEEAGVSRLYGGIHFRAAIERGLDQGRCVATHVNALETRS
jgi:hypothetical protein